MDTNTKAVLGEESEMRCSPHHKCCSHQPRVSCMHHLSAQRTPSPRRPPTKWGCQPWEVCHLTTVIWSWYPWGNVYCTSEVLPARQGPCLGKCPYTLKQEQRPPWEVVIGWVLSSNSNQISSRRRGRGGLKMWVGARWPCWDAPSWRVSLLHWECEAVLQGKPPQILTMATARHLLDGGLGGIRSVILGLSI